jgi:hypothetical protein
MKEALSLIQERLAKAEARASRAEKAWESAKAEVTDLRTALRVMSELSGDSPAASSGTVSTWDRQQAIVALLAPGQEHGKSPADLFEKYKAQSDEDINIDTFRTTIWRMKDHTYTDMFGMWTVKGDSGSYWKVPSSMNAVQHQHAQRVAEPPAVSASDFEFDDDAPF